MSVFLRSRIWLLLSGTLMALMSPSTADTPHTGIVSQVQLVLGDQNVTSVIRRDLDRDGRVETVAITRRSTVGGHPMGGYIVVLHESGKRLSGVWRHPNLNPWKLVIADVDGDGRREIVAGVWKKSPKDPVMARRTFIYSWNGHRMLPKWLGSRLSRRFDDFTLCDINRDGWDELLSLEKAPSSRHRVAAYRWNVFGFDWLGCSKDLSGLTSLDVEHGRPVARGRSLSLPLSLAHGRIVAQQRD